MNTQICRTNEAEQLRKGIVRILDRLTDDQLKEADVFLRNYFRLEVLNERQD